MEALSALARKLEPFASSCFEKFENMVEVTIPNLLGSELYAGIIYGIIIVFMTKYVIIPEIQKKLIKGAVNFKLMVLTTKRGILSMLRFLRLIGKKKEGKLLLTGPKK